MEAGGAMNWDALGAIGEILGAIAVVVSLSYLAAQIRNQNRESRLTAMREMSLGFRTSTAKLLDSGLTGIFVKCMDSFDVLTDEEKLKLVIGITAVFRAWEEAYIQHEMGNLDDRAWRPMLSYYTLILSSPAGQNVWILRKQHFDEEFRSFADALELMEYSLASQPDVSNPML
jgi:hypothetical protein